MIALALIAAATLCGPPSAHTLASTHRARIYSRAAAVYGCVRGHRPTHLGTDKRFRSQLDRFALAGSHVAFEQASHGIDTSSASIVLVDLRSGRRLELLPATAPPSRAESFASVTALVLGGRGGSGVAWIASSSSVGRPTISYEVHAGRRLLDAGADVDPQSLALRGASVTWRRGGALHSAPLRP